jgi:hypothetical protein
MTFKKSVLITLFSTISTVGFLSQLCTVHAQKTDDPGYSGDVNSAGDDSKLQNEKKGKYACLIMKLPGPNEIKNRISGHEYAENSVPEEKS